MTSLLRAGFLRRVALTPLVLMLVTPAVSRAQQVQPTGVVKEGGFLGVSFTPAFTFDGVSFDGETFYREVDGDELLFLPRLDKSNMFRGVLGYRSREASLEISYERTQHTGTVFDIPLDSTFQAVNVDGRYFFARQSRVQPHVLVGAAFPWFTVKEGSLSDENATEIGDAKFRGYGLNTEAGVTIYPVPRFGLGVGYSYRIMWFDRATGVTDTLYELRPRFRETSGSLAVTATVIF